MKQPVVHLAYEALAPQPPIKEVIEKLASESSVGVIAGEAGDGKTLLMMIAGVSVAGSYKFGSLKTTQGNVLFVDEESGLIRFNLRLQKIMNGLGADSSLPFFYTSLSLFNFTYKPDLQELEKLIVGYSIKFVIIDAFMDVTPGADENAVKDIAPVMQGLRQIAEKTKCAIVIIHHNNKSGNYRGSTAIKGAVDNLITVKKTANVITLQSEKARDSEPFEISFKIHFEDDKIYLTDAQKIKFGPAQEFVIKFLAQNGTSSMSDIKVNANGCKPDAARLAVMDLSKSRFIKRTDNGGPGTPGFYDLADEGNKVAAERNWFNDPWKIADYATCSL